MWKMGEVQGADALLPEFANNYLNTGGDVGKSTLLMLHCVPGARDAKEIVRDVWMVRQRPGARGRRLCPSHDLVITCMRLLGSRNLCSPSWP